MRKCGGKNVGCDVEKDVQNDLRGQGVRFLPHSTD
jgi:hypothetical protein